MQQHWLIDGLAAILIWRPLWSFRKVNAPSSWPPAVHRVWIGSVTVLSINREDKFIRKVEEWEEKWYGRDNNYLDVPGLLKETIPGIFFFDKGQEKLKSKWKCGSQPALSFWTFSFIRNYTALVYLLSCVFVFMKRRQTRVFYIWFITYDVTCYRGWNTGLEHGRNQTHMYSTHVQSELAVFCMNDANCIRLYLNSCIRLKKK